jgi:hypothetical protein
MATTFEQRLAAAVAKIAPIAADIANAETEFPDIIGQTGKVADMLRGQTKP